MPKFIGAQIPVEGGVLWFSENKEKHSEK